jgi:hypothetical protein
MRRSFHRPDTHCALPSSGCVPPTRSAAVAVSGSAAQSLNRTARGLRHLGRTAWTAVPGRLVSTSPRRAQRADRRRHLGSRRGPPCPRRSWRHGSPPAARRGDSGGSRGEGVALMRKALVRKSTRQRKAGPSVAGHPLAREVGVLHRRLAKGVASIRGCSVSRLAGLTPDITPRS